MFYTRYTMEYKLAFTIPLALIFMILASNDGASLNVIAQGVAIKNDSTSGIKIKIMDNTTTIITPWNTGNDKNDSTAGNNNQTRP